MPKIQIDQRRIHVLYLVKVINAKQSVPRLSGYDARKALIEIWRSGFDSGQGCYLLLFFYLIIFV